MMLRHFVNQCAAAASRPNTCVGRCAVRFFSAHSTATPLADCLGWTVKPVGDALGAELLDVDLATAGQKEYDAIKEALLAYQVVFFREQDTFTPAAHRALAEFFGPLQTHPAYPSVENFPEITILENDADNPSLIEKWHTDMTFMPQPPLGSILHGLIIPDGGRGDTEFLSMAAAYDDLDEDLKVKLRTLTAEHSFEYGFQESLAQPGGRERLAQALADNPPVQHPVVRAHPDSGRHTLFVNCLFTTRVLGMDDAESKELLEFLYDHMLKDKFRYSFKWRPNSVAFWDNRITQHLSLIHI